MSHDRTARLISWIIFITLVFVYAWRAFSETYPEITNNIRFNFLVPSSQNQGKDKIENRAQENKIDVFNIWTSLIYMYANVFMNVLLSLFVLLLLLLLLNYVVLDNRLHVDAYIVATHVLDREYWTLHFAIFVIYFLSTLIASYFATLDQYNDETIIRDYFRIFVCSWFVIVSCYIIFFLKFFLSKPLSER